MFTLLFDILLDCFFRDLSCGSTKITYRPKVLTTELFLQLREFHLQFSGALSFQVLNDSRYCHVWWNTQKQVDVVRTDRSLEDIYFVCGANLPDDLPRAVSDVIFEDFLTILGDPNYVILIVVNCMACAFVPCHALIMLKPWTKVQSVPLGGRHKLDITNCDIQKTSEKL